MERRIRRLGVVMLLLFIGLFVQLNNIQVFKAHGLATASANPRNFTDEYQYPRGTIYSADGLQLAYSEPSTNAYYKYQRVYPANTASLFAQITGFDSILYGHLTGVEGEYNSFLTAHTPPAKTLRDLLTDRTQVDDVTLTVNSGLQEQTAAAVDSAPGGSPAAAVVLNPTTGAVEAMYANPTFDPNPLSSLNLTTQRLAWFSYNQGGYGNTPLLSNAFQTTYEPGSTFKIVTTSAVLETRPDLASMTYPSIVQIPLPNSGGQFLHNYHYSSCGGNLAQIVAFSCDADFAQIGLDLYQGNPQTLTQQAQAYGFNQQIPIDLPGSGVSQFPTAGALLHNAPGRAKAAIGQELTYSTALQMALVAEGVANGGVVMTPHLMAQIRDNQGNLVESYAPTPWMRAVSQQTAATLTTFMQGVVTMPGGTAARVGFPAAWQVAAKTGTAETGVTNQLTNDWMIAFAPASHPTVAVAVVVPNQPASATGAETTGPIMKQILAAALGMPS